VTLCSRGPGWYRAGVKRVLPAAALALAVLSPGDAHADAATWCYVGGGGLVWRQGTSDFIAGGAVNADVGMGTSPQAPFVIGGFGRLTGIIGDHTGADLGILVRGATGSFARGTWGIAVDAGGFARFWGPGHAGFTGGLTLGAPLGVSLTMQVMYGAPFDTTKAGDLLGFGGTLGIDFARLLIHREQLEDRWPNPRPAKKAGVLGILF